MDNFIFVSNTAQEAKRKVDMLLGWNSGEIPLFGNSDPQLARRRAQAAA
jgi:hypothetical protein